MELRAGKSGKGASGANQIHPRLVDDPHAALAQHAQDRIPRDGRRRRGRPERAVYFLLFLRPEPANQEIAQFKIR